jgi:RyR domain
MPSALDTLAAAIHETWRTLAQRQGWKMQPRFDRNFDALGADDQEDNRAAARRIPWVLGLAGLAVESGQPASGSSAPGDEEISRQLEFHMERLAEAEHDGWMEHRRKSGWQFGETRDDEKLIHPLLVPYSKLPETEKEKDRNTIRHFPRFVRQAGYRIVWLGADARG